MLFFLVSFVSFLLLLTKPLPLHFPSWVSVMWLLFVLLCQEFLSRSIHWLKNYKLASTQILKFSYTMFPISNKNLKLRHGNVKEEEVFADAGMNLLHLPELALDLILEKLSPNGLLSMAKVCKSLGEKCKSDHFWERHFRDKWGRVIGESAKREWDFHFASMMNECKRNGINVRQNWVVDSLSCVWPCSWFVNREEGGGGEIGRSCLPNDSVMAWYLTLESGRFWFPAQVYNREQNGHVGFLLSCYDAELSYDSQADTFNARYSLHGKRATDVEEGVPWERLRTPPVETQPHQLHISDCLHDLRPGDHIEIQWRRNIEFPYGWWYGLVGHLESCDGVEHHCRCYSSDTVIIEFNQHSLGSPWRKTVINRKNHQEGGNESDGFYGGIRKLYSNHEISMWRRLWPNDVLE